MKHTPGPWSRNRWFIRSGNELVAEIIPWDVSGCREEDNANAKLIAAAPEMLEVLEEMLSDYREFPVEVIEK